jgi:hypothetical protein
LAALVVLAVAAGLYLYAHKKPDPNLATGNKQAVTGATSKPTPHQLTATTNGTTQSGGIVDRNGKTSGSLPPASQWVSSASGNITLQQPSPNAVLKSGDTLSGLAKVNSVQFILKDDSVGLIARGNLNVTDGKFAGVLQFTPHSNSGTLEVYYPNPNNGAEEDIVEINVGFSNQ